MPKFRDEVTGKIEDFDHEPSQQELAQRFGVASTLAGPSLGGPKPYDAEAEKSMAAPSLGGMLGGLIGGKTPLGKIGAGIGAAAGTAYGDLYNMFAHGVGDTTPSSEAQRLATVGGLTSAAEVALPPILRGVGALKNFLPKGFGGLAAPAAGYALGHPGYGMAAGATMEAAPQVAAGIDWLGTPAGTSAGNTARAAALEGLPPAAAARPQIQAEATAQGNAARAKAGGPLAEVPDYLQQQNWGSSLRSAGNSIKNTATSALEGLQGMFGGGTVAPPQAPPSPMTAMQPDNVARVPKSMSDISERLGVTGQPVSSQANISRNPNMRWNADVTAAPQRTPQLTQTSPTDPKSDWQDHTSRSAPKRTATGGQSFQSAEVGTHPDVFKATEQGPLSGLKAATPEMPVGVHDDGLERWVAAGGSPESYARATAALKSGGDPNFNQGAGDPMLAGSHPYGPNTVGAAQAKLPPKFNTVDEAEGMSLLDQGAFDSYKRNNPGADIDQWFRQHGQTEDTNAGLDIPSMIDKLTALLKPR